MEHRTYLAVTGETLLPRMIGKVMLEQTHVFFPLKPVSWVVCVKPGPPTRWFFKDVFLGGKSSLGINRHVLR